MIIPEKGSSWNVHYRIQNVKYILTMDSKLDVRNKPVSIYTLNYAYICLSQKRGRYIKLCIFF